MPSKRKLIEKEALKLTRKQRMKLAVNLLESAEPGITEDKKSVDAAWEREIARRIAEIDSGKVKLIPWEKVRKEIRGKLRARTGTSAA